MPGTIAQTVYDVKHFLIQSLCLAGHPARDRIKQGGKGKNGNRSKPASVFFGFWKIRRAIHFHPDAGICPSPEVFAANRTGIICRKRLAPNFL